MVGGGRRAAAAAWAARRAWRAEMGGGEGGEGEARAEEVEPSRVEAVDSIE